MNVLLVTALVAGGVGRHVEMLVRGLRAEGHRVVVACPPAVAARFDLGDRVVELPFGARPHPLRDRRTVSILRSTLRGADVVHAHGLRAGALAAVARGVPRPADRHPRLVVTTHNGPPDGRRGQAAYAVMEHLLAHGADLVLGVSPDLVERAARRGAAQTALAVVPAASETAPGAAPARREEVRTRVRHELGLGEGGDPLLVVNVGRLAAALWEEHRVVEEHFE